MKVAVIGTGYVGLVVGACLSETGNDVVCVDTVEEKVERLKRGEIPIYEPGLDDIVERNLEAGRLRFTTDTAEAVRASDIVFIAVGTPQDGDGSADLQHVLQVATDVGRAMDGEKIVITKSTVPVGTARRVREAIVARTEHPVHVCSNPEFLKEGAAVDDFMKPDRVVLGVDSERAGEVLRELYAPFVRTGNEILLMDIASAEITKYAANAMLATRISFMNAVARLCERAGADVNQVRLGVGSDGRIGPSFLFPGVGYGGSCFPKDVKALIRTFHDLQEPCSIFEAVESVNERQKRLLLERVEERFAVGAAPSGAGDLSGRTFAVWGLSFKPKTDDMREAPSLVTIRGLLERGARVVAHDPAAVDEARRILGEGESTGGGGSGAAGDGETGAAGVGAAGDGDVGAAGGGGSGRGPGGGSIEYREKNYDALDGADALIIHTEWLEYRRPDFQRMKRLLNEPVIFDGRNLYDPDRMREMGFEYWSVGRPPVVPAD